MFQSSKLLRAAVATLGLAVVAGCAANSSGTAPELAGAWYQVYFDSNGSDIDSRGRMIVDTVAYVATNNGATRVTVIGKTDRVGGAGANLALSKRRADAVRDALITAGVPATHIDTSWSGEARQEVATANDTAEQRNRVVDITVVKQSR